MSSRLDDLASQYPLVYRAYLKPRRHDKCPIAHRGFECGEGWFAIVDVFSAWLEAEATRLHEARKRVPVIAQCKEKMGTLAIHVSNFPASRFPELMARIDAAQRASKTTCELCGQPGVLRESGFQQTRCRQCFEMEEPSL